jgi:dGTPase
MTKALGHVPGYLPPGRLLGVRFSPPPRARYATRPDDSRGRYWREDESATRTCYQRDRDRLIHSTAFRRLKHKTQVFVQHEGDYYRTRLTHSLEVAQIARAIARDLGLDEDLAEALALAHDFGHPPFGHAGEDALDACMKDHGGFDHNAQALSLVTRLEHRYAAFDGLNLTWETLEGLVKHNGPLLSPGSDRADLPEAITTFPWDLELESHAGPEAQVAALSDDIAYVNHDIDDGLRAGLFAPSDLMNAPLAGTFFREVAEKNPGLELGRHIGEAIRRLIGAMVEDVVAETRRRLDGAAPQSAASIRKLGAPIAAFSEPLLPELLALKDFLFRRMYRHARIAEVMARAQGLLTELFTAYINDPGLLPADWKKSAEDGVNAATARAVCDYIAGMTDAYAQAEYRRIFHMEFRL